ncbi:helix-turn-helix transcriptional regulator [Ralstonia solanacearum]|uniref:helix-turn-helix transcriptional regulator n=1 Tax=Ralstonia solanacearum TaxID=305 RepID=UPI0007C8E7BE|nr:helix-turn-helix transcriptional regulator [Ralstonia solanacearum]AST33759.2 helix-turn-helix transcriptional regulator [Ralstonia solanacearum]ATJ87644.1 LuxR family transcriptional regulator [Ralstonia solanacearum]AYB52913.1 helix-turn-helix transcriptional regulator [Ralstonia solanacearum]AYB57486.1 helix-turn-helix transcriptional regulator [Ralstonia solanacearum]MDB0510548.1 helix-turn-helix transcriptional regulator [Ralstonia solanacearum]
MTLSLADLRTLLDLTGCLHEASPHSLIERPEITQKLSALLGVDVISHIVWKDHGRTPVQTTTWGRAPDMNAEYQQHFHGVDPISPLLRSRPDALLVEGLINRGALQRTEYFTDFLTRYKIYPGMSMYLEDTGGILLDYRLGTSDPKQTFGERELLILDLLRPHLINAQRLRSALNAHRNPTDPQADCPCFMLDPAKPPQPNRKARALMAGLDEGEREAVHRLLSQVAAHGPSQGLEWCGFNLCVERCLDTEGRFLYKVYLQAHTMGSGAWFQQQFDVTRREGEVCHLLLKGLSDKQIALALGISYWTVRAHVGRILEKLGIESRSAIGTLVLGADR